MFSIIISAQDTTSQPGRIRYQLIVCSVFWEELYRLGYLVLATLDVTFQEIGQHSHFHYIATCKYFLCFQMYNFNFFA